MLFEQPDALPDIPPAVLAAMKADRLAELARLRDIGMKKVDRLEQAADGELTPEELKVLLRGRGIVKEFERVCKAIRQIMALEWEIQGIWVPVDRDPPKPPEPDEPPDRYEPTGLHREPGPLSDDIDDYSHAPMDVVVAEIREAVDAPPPAGTDPFAPPSQPRPKRKWRRRKPPLPRSVKIRRAAQKAEKKAWRLGCDGPARPKSTRKGIRFRLRGQARGRGPPR